MVNIQNSAGKILGKGVKSKESMEKIFSGVLIFLGFIIVICLLGALLAYPVMLLWNGCLVPAVAVIHIIGWKQAWGLIILFSILFKSNSKSNNSSK
jgi:hypothetical protein